MSDLGRLDDPDYPALTIGQAAELLGVRAPFLRSLDKADVLRPARSEGGQRRYSRRQLALAARLRELFDEGHTLTAAAHIVGLEDELAAAHEEITSLREQAGEAGDAGDTDPRHS